MRKNIIYRTIALSMFSLVLVFVLSGCGSDKDRKQKEETKKSTEQSKLNSEELKKPIFQEDVDKELKAIDADIEDISSDDLDAGDLDEKSL
jgi:uncharacterized lipoprotein YehR (DUF1307 family)